MGDALAPMAGRNLRTYQRGSSGSPADPFVVYAPPRIETGRYYASTPIIPGRGVASQGLLYLFNRGAQTFVTDLAITAVNVDVIVTAGKGAGVLGGWVRLSRTIIEPTGGVGVSKVARRDSSMSLSSGQVACLSDSNDDGTGGAGTSAVNAMGAITPIIPVIATVAAPRILSTTASGYELVDTVSFLAGEPELILHGGEGILVTVDYAGTGNAASTGNPTTNKWIVTVEWTEFAP